MDGGYASHLGIDPKFFTAATPEEKGLDFANRILRPLFFNEAMEERVSPFYLYVNVTTPETLRRVLADPKRYAPSGVYSRHLCQFPRPVSRHSGGYYPTAGSPFLRSGLTAPSGHLLCRKFFQNDSGALWHTVFESSNGSDTDV